MNKAEKPFSEACERNQEPIREVLASVLTEPADVLELGSGTGQHAVYFARHLPHLTWQPSDVPEALPGIELWCREARLSNLLDPISLDVTSGAQGVDEAFDAVFTANTVHFVSWDVVRALFAVSAEKLREGGDLLIYGPFNEAGVYTSEGNRRLDAWLHSRDPQSGIKERGQINELAAEYGLDAMACFEMPANNQLLHFRRSAG